MYTSSISLLRRSATFSPFLTRGARLANAYFSSSTHTKPKPTHPTVEQERAHLDISTDECKTPRAYRPLLPSTEFAMFHRVKPVIDVEHNLFSDDINIDLVSKDEPSKRISSIQMTVFRRLRLGFIWKIFTAPPQQLQHKGFSRFVKNIAFREMGSGLILPNPLSRRSKDGRRAFDLHSRFTSKFLDYSERRFHLTSDQRTPINFTQIPAEKFDTPYFHMGDDQASLMLQPLIQIPSAPDPTTCSKEEFEERSRDRKESIRFFALCFAAIYGYSMGVIFLASTLGSSPSDTAQAQT